MKVIKESELEELLKSNKVLKNMVLNLRMEEAYAHEKQATLLMLETQLDILETIRDKQYCDHCPAIARYCVEDVEKVWKMDERGDFEEIKDSEPIPGSTRFLCEKCARELKYIQ